MRRLLQSTFMQDWLAEQRRRNRETQNAWDDFSSHRRRATDLLVAAATGRSRPTLCLLGAGNCNDLELPQLLKIYSEIHLVDADDHALAAGIERQIAGDQGALQLHAGIGVSDSQVSDVLR